MSLAHLARRARQVALPGQLSMADVRLVRSILLPHELRLFSAAAPSDQTHGFRVACGVRERLGDDPRWLRAALLHDAGKARAHLGLVGRTATAAFAFGAPVAAARMEQRAITALSPDRLIDPVGPTLRVGACLAHGPIGAAWLASHGTEEEVAAWVRVHHRQECWPEIPLDDEVIRVLAECDE
jgi:hypothetical protein